MSLTKKRLTYRPLEYKEAHDYWLKQQQAHWLGTEVALTQDVLDWETKLTKSEKSVIGGILKGFTQTEVLVNNYWNHVAHWFPVPEVAMAATTMAAYETIHMHAYSLLDETLGFNDYATYIAEPAIKARLDRLLDPHGKTREEKAKSLAVFSAFTEGVSLFSSFAVLLHFSRFNKLKGVSQIVSYSIRDEVLHADFGCYLFRKLMDDNQDLWTDEFKKSLYQAARDTVELEDKFLDKVFEDGEIEHLQKDDVKNFIRNRANAQLGKLGLKQNWKNIDKDALKRMDWFDVIAAGTRLDDFFFVKPHDYSKGVVNFDGIFDE